MQTPSKVFCLDGVSLMGLLRNMPAHRLIGMASTISEKTTFKKT